jgi:hypothetical protein
MKTKAGVEYNLKVSPYSCTFGKLRFIFSSQLHLDKFILKREINARDINESLSNRFKFDVNMQALCDISLYRQIETRGFRIQNEKGEYLCIENLILNGERATKKEPEKQ